MANGIDYIGVSVGAIIINQKKQILLTKRGENCKNERGCWEAPGGAVDFNEKLDDAVKREIIEELGVDIILLKQFPAKNHILASEKQHWVASSFLCKIKAGQTPKIMEPHKFDDIGWFDIDNLPAPLSIITQMDIVEYKKFSESKIELGKYDHFKNKSYEVIATAKHHETLEDFVVYKALYDNQVSPFWIRELDDFKAEVTRDGKTFNRFVKEV